MEQVALNRHVNATANRHGRLAATAALLFMREKGTEVKSENRRPGRRRLKAKGLAAREVPGMNIKPK